MVHDLAGNHMLHDFAANTGERNGPVRPGSSQPDTSVPTGPLVTITTDFESCFLI